MCGQWALEAPCQNWYPMPVISGVPQGSVLGPLLFLIYINNLNSNINNSILKFVDDAKIVNKIIDESDRDRLQHLLKLVTWSEEWQMMFNASKCKVMHFGKNQVSRHDFMKN